MSKITKIVWLIIFIAVLFAGGLVYFLDQSTPEQIASTEGQVSEIVEPDVTAAFNDLVQSANSSNHENTKKLALDLALDTNQVLIVRLDAFRLCIQSSIASSDKTTQDYCYGEAVKLVNLSNDGDFTKNWLDYLNSVNNGVSSNINQDDNDQR